MGFFPAGPLTTVYALILLTSMFGVVWLSRDEALRNLAVVMFVSWLGARFATWADAIWIYATATIVLCAVALFLAMSSKSAVAQRISFVVACLFGAKLLVCYLPYVAGLIDVEVMWAWSEVAAYGQILALVGGSLTGGKRAWNQSLSSGNRSPISRKWVVLQFSRLMPSSRRSAGGG